MLFGTETAELAVLDFIQKTFKCGFLDFLMLWMSWLGNGGMIWIAITVFMLLSKKYRKTGIMNVAALICCLLIVNIGLKNLVARPRPCWLNDGVQMLIAIPKDFSFPSGHSAASFAAACVIFSQYKKTGIAAMALAALIAFSRMYLYVHFPTDILGGVIIGVLIGIIVPSVFKKRTY